MRCEIAAALLHAPEVIFLDEPTIGLDVIARQRIRELIREMNRDEGTTVFLTSHDAGDVEQVCRRAIVVNHGRIVCDASIARLKRDYLRTPGRPARPSPSRPRTSRSRARASARAIPHRATLEVDLDRTSIEAVVARSFARYPIADIAVAEPPMEAMIAAIYAGEPWGAEDPVAGASGSKYLAVGRVTLADARSPTCPRCCCGRSSWPWSSTSSFSSGP